MFNLDNALGIHPQALEVRAERARLLAQNIAHADTPRYQARDLDFSRVLKASTEGHANPRLQATHVNHLTPEGGAFEAETLWRVPFQPSLDGNTVDTQIEYSEFARNAMQYQAGLTFLSGRIRTLRTAIRGD